MKQAGIISFFILFPALSFAQTFEDIALQSGIDFYFTHFGNIGGGAAFFDYDNDGDDDIYLTGGQTADKLYRNDGDAIFTDVSTQTGIGIVTQNHFTNGVTIGDINNDGFRDIFVATYFGIGHPSRRNLIFLNNGNGTFSEFSQFAGIVDDDYSIGATMFDYDNDGYLDIYVVNYVEESGAITDGSGQVIGFDHLCFPNLLYLNNGDLTFTEVSQEVGFTNLGCSLASMASDIDNDGDLELFEVNDFGAWGVPNSLFNYQADNNTFEDIGAATGADVQIYGMGIAKGDYDLDQDFDYYMTNIGANVFLQNDGTGTFTDIATDLGVHNTLGPFGFKLTTSWGTAFIDYNNDLYEDLFVANGFIPAANFIGTATLDPNKLFFNNGDGTFTEVSDAEGFNSDRICRGLAYGDIDNDGDMDLMVSNQQHPSSVEESKMMLYRNNTQNSNNWLKVKLTGVACNRDAIGSKVRVFVDDLTLMREIDGGSSHASQHSIIAHFGLGEYTNVDSLKIDWIGGETETFYNLEVNQQHDFTQYVYQSAMIDFQLNMQYEDVSPDGVFWIGLNGEPIEMSDDDGDLIFTLSLEVEQGIENQYAYQNGTCVELDCIENLLGQSCNSFNNPSLRYLPAVYSDTIFVDCFNQCDYALCGVVPIDSFDITFELNMGENIIAETGIFLAGDLFGIPGALPMSDPEGDGIYTITTRQPEGFSSFYTFTNGNCADYNCGEDLNGQNCADPNNNDFRFFGPIGQDTVLQACFGECDVDLICTPPPSPAMVTFTVDMQYQLVAENGVSMRADFEDWNGSVQLSDDDQDDLWEVTLALNAGQYEYQFINGDATTGVAENLDISGDCTIESGEAINRFLVVPEMAETIQLDTVCFEACLLCPTDAVKEQLDLSKLLLQPNPTSGSTVLFIQNATGRTKHLHVLNTQGQVMQQSLLNNAQSTVQINAQNWPKGLYAIQLIIDGQLLVKSLIVQ